MTTQTEFNFLLSFNISSRASMPPPLPAQAALPRLYRAGGVGGRAPFGRTPPDPASAFVCPLPACAGGGGGSCAQRALPTPRPSGGGLFFLISRQIGGEPTTASLPRRAHHGEPTTASPQRRAHHGEPTTASPQRRAHHGEPTTASPPRRAHHGEPTTANLTIGPPEEVFFDFAPWYKKALRAFSYHGAKSKTTFTPPESLARQILKSKTIFHVVLDFRISLASEKVVSESPVGHSAVFVGYRLKLCPSGTCPPTHP